MVKCECGNDIFTMLSEGFDFNTEGHTRRKELWMCDECEALYVWYYRLEKVVLLSEGAELK